MRKTFRSCKKKQNNIKFNYKNKKMNIIKLYKNYKITYSSKKNNQLDLKKVLFRAYN